MPLASGRRFPIAIALVEAIVVLAAVIVLQYVLASASRKPAMRDFRVVYCGERAVSVRADPYRVEPLRACENAVDPTPGEAPWAVTPYPLPGYAAAVLLPLAFLPFHAAAFVWLCLLTLGFAIATVVLAEVARARTWAIALVLAPTVGILNQYYGEPIDIAIAAFCIAALCVARDRPRSAALACGAAMIEPHIGLPACIGLFVFAPRARVTLVALALGLAALAIAALGPRTCAEYLTTFLPMQARAELYAADQYSASRLFFLSGSSAPVSLAIGTLWYAVMVVLGIVAASRLVALGLSRALLVLLPVAAAMLGGSFVHDVEIASALPAAIVLAPRSAFARISVSLLAMQWGFPIRNVIGMLGTATVGVVSFALPHASLARRVAYAVAVVVVLAAIDAACVPLLHRHGLRGTPGDPITPATIASIPWEWSIRLAPVSLDFDPRQIWMKIPSWIALLAILLSVFELTGRRVAAETPSDGLLPVQNFTR